MRPRPDRPLRRPRRLTALLSAAAATVALGACGAGDEGSRPDASAALVLDAAPGAVHVGIYQAVARDFTGAEGVTLAVRAPAAGSSPTKALLGGRTQFAIMDIAALARARARGSDLVGVMAIVEDPLPDVAARAGVVLPKGLRGVPDYPELVLVTTRTTVQDDPALVQATVTALQRGYRESISDPESAVSALVDAVPGTDRARLGAELDDVQPAFQATNGLIGTLDLTALGRWATWAQRRGIVAEAPDPAQMFVPRYAAAGAKKATENSG